LVGCKHEFASQAFVLVSEIFVSAGEKQRTKRKKKKKKEGLFNE